MIDLRKHGTGIVKEGAASIRQLDAARLAAEQLGIDFAFDRPDLPTERRRLDAEPVRGARDVSRLGARDDIAQLPQLHCPYPEGNAFDLAPSLLDRLTKTDRFLNR